MWKFSFLLLYWAKWVVWIWIQFLITIGNRSRMRLNTHPHQKIWKQNQKDCLWRGTYHHFAQYNSNFLIFQFFFIFHFFCLKQLFLFFRKWWGDHVWFKWIWTVRVWSIWRTNKPSKGVTSKCRNKFRFMWNVSFILRNL